MALQDDRLINQTLAGDREAFGILYKTYCPRIHGVIIRRVSNRDDVEDLVQMTFLHALSGLKSFRRESAFLTWLTRIALNVCTSHLRAYRGRQRWIKGIEEPTFWSDSKPSHYDAFDKALHQKEQRELVRQSIRELPAHHREMVWMHYIKELSYLEIVQELQVPIGTVKTWLYRARIQLKRKLQKSGSWTM